MLRISSLIICLFLCFPAFAQYTKKEKMLEARNLLEKYNWKDAEKLVFTFAENGDAEAQYLMSRIRNFELNDVFASGRNKLNKYGEYRHKNSRKRQSLLDTLSKQSWNWLLKANSQAWILNKTTSDEDSIRIQYVACHFNPDYPYNEKYQPNGLLAFDFKKRIEITRKAAEKNIYNSRLSYSRLISNDSLESFKWLSLAAENNYAEAIYDLGTAYYLGKPVKKDINKALGYFSKALEDGWYEAARSLGWIYNEGKEVERDLDKAIYYYEKYYQYLLKERYAMSRNYPLLWIGEIYVEKKDYKKALRTYKLAIPNSDGIGKIRYRMGEIYAHFEQYNKAIYWLIKSDYKDASKKLTEIRNR